MSAHLELSPADWDWLRSHGLDEREVERQLACYQRPPNYARLVRPCTVGDGIVRLEESEQQDLVALYERAPERARAVKFVPASGAASRMFKSLLALVAQQRPLRRAELEGEPARFFDGLPRFAFYPDLAAVMARDGLDIGAVLEGEDLRPILEYLLEERGLGYARLPKALLAFHRYGDEVRTAFEEHLVEGAAVSGGKTVRLHFTVSPAHHQRFENLFARVRDRFEKRLGTTFDVEFSFQDPATDSIAVDPEGRPFRDRDGRLLLRPSGHGALLGNLAACDADLVFIKNIDNVAVDHLRGPTVWWKKVLGGYALRLRARCNDLLEGLAAGKTELRREAAAFLASEFGVEVEQSEETGRLADFLDRPLRVCGMVRNTGEPGGGPFWVASPGGQVRRQIVESSQVDLNDPEQRAILEASTHFNPVDLVCVLRDRRGRSYPLERYVDERAYLVVEKSHEGRPLRSLERPGLWNGAMAGWNTVFVEVPVETFNPVKTVIDLLRPAHQPQAVGG